MAEITRGMQGYDHGDFEDEQRLPEPLIPADAKDFEVFAIKGNEAFIGFKLANGNFHFIGVPYTEPKKDLVESKS